MSYFPKKFWTGFHENVKSVFQTRFIWNLAFKNSFTTYNSSYTGRSIFRSPSIMEGSHFPYLLSVAFSVLTLLSVVFSWTPVRSDEETPHTWGLIHSFWILMIKLHQVNLQIAMSNTEIWEVKTADGARR